MKSVRSTAELESEALLQLAVVIALFDEIAKRHRGDNRQMVAVHAVAAKLRLSDAAYLFEQSRGDYRTREREHWRERFLKELMEQARSIDEETGGFKPQRA